MARNQTEKKVKQALLTESSLAELVQVSDKLDAAVKDPESIVGTKLLHIWHDDGKGVVYNGKVLTVKEQTKQQTEKRETILEISYWKEEVETDAEDFDIPLVHFLTDAIVGDLVLLD